MPALNKISVLLVNQKTMSLSQRLFVKYRSTHLMIASVITSPVVKCQMWSCIACRISGTVRFIKNGYSSNKQSPHEMI